MSPQILNFAKRMLDPQSTWPKRNRNSCCNAVRGGDKKHRCQRHHWNAIRRDHMLVTTCVNMNDSSFEAGVLSVRNSRRVTLCGIQSF